MLAKCRRWIRAYPGDQLVEQLRGVGLGADNGTEQVTAGGRLSSPAASTSRWCLKPGGRGQPAKARSGPP